MQKAKREEEEAGEDELEIAASLRSGIKETLVKYVDVAVSESILSFCVYFLVDSDENKKGRDTEESTLFLQAMMGNRESGSIEHQTSKRKNGGSKGEREGKEGHLTPHMYNVATCTSSTLDDCVMLENRVGTLKRVGPE